MSATSSGACYINTSFYTGDSRYQELAKNEDLAREVVLKALGALRELDLGLGVLLDLVCWGSEQCKVDPVIRTARTALMSYPYLGEIVKRLHTPPGYPPSKSPAAARTVMEKFAFDCVDDILDNQMKYVGTLLASDRNFDQVSEKFFLTINCQTLMAQIKERTPQLWDTCRKLAYTEGQQARNTMKSPDWVSQGIQ
jgi:hypothetical protein